MPTPVADWLERAVADLDVFRALRALERSARRGLAWLAAHAPVAAQAARHAREVLATLLRALWERAREAAGEAAAAWRRARSDRARPSPAPRDPARAARGRWLAPAALIAAGAIVAALLIDALAGAGRGHRAPAHRAPHASSPAGAAARTASPSRQAPLAGGLPLSRRTSRSVTGAAASVSSEICQSMPINAPPSPGQDWSCGSWSMVVWFVWIGPLETNSGRKCQSVPGTSR